MNRKDTLLITAVIIIIILGGYIATEKINFCENAKNESLMLGQQQGTLFWNNFVVKTVTEQGELPYIINNSVQSIPIAQLYQGVLNG